MYHRIEIRFFQTTTSNSSDNYLRKREQRTAKRLAIVVGFFICCWLPFFVVYLITPFMTSDKSIPDFIYTVFTWLGWVNSALNPFLYGWFDLQFRMAFKRLTFGLVCSRPARPATSKSGGSGDVAKKGSMVRMGKKPTVHSMPLSEKAV